MDVKMSLPLMSALRSGAGAAAGVGGLAAGQGAAAGGLAGAVPAGRVGASNFGSALDQALRSVSQTQEEAGSMQRAFQSGVDGVSLEQTMVAMQKAQIAFQGATTVRNRLVSAYTDIMNMNV
jgi:flagellar hook-basal body complex protein FliE